MDEFRTKWMAGAFCAMVSCTTWLQAQETPTLAPEHAVQFVSPTSYENMLVDQPACDTGCTTPAPCDTATGCDTGSCQAGCCTCQQKQAAQAKAKKSHKGVFYANDFNYLCDPCYDGCLLGDHLKRLCVGDCGTLDVGGQLRLRYHHEEGLNKGQSTRFTNTTDDFLLTRLRLYANYEMNDLVRFYVEGIYADTGGQSLPARGTDINQGDLLNAFADLKLVDGLTFRIGRQELLYGAQRTVSPLDWANTRRTFEGLKAIWKQDDLQIDAFWTAFVPVRPFAFDEADWQRKFYGVYSTYSGLDRINFDFYYLGFDNAIALSSLHTFGTRAHGSHGNWLYEFEGAYQGGDAAGVGVDQDAGFATIGLGRKLPCLPWTPTLWAYFDYASGDVPGGDFNGYNQLFPLAHKYLGFIDAVQRSNIESVNFLLTAKPCKKVNLLAWYYIFQSNQPGAVPSIGGTPPQNASRDLGQELDLVVKYSISPRSNVLLGYSHFWRGDKITTSNDADFVYGQWTLNF